MIHLVDELAELALGTMDARGRAEAQQHLDACPRCRSELASSRELLAALGLALPPEPPAPSTRDRLLRDATVPGPSAFADLLARLFDLGPEQASAVIRMALDGRSWGPGLVRGMQIIPFRGGPQVAAAECYLARFRANVRVPEHRHLGPELTAVLDGGFVEDGSEDDYAAGSTLLKLPGSSHAFTCESSGCLAAVALFDGMAIEDRGTVRIFRKPSVD
jgi:putative transcriptional regulator